MNVLRFAIVALAIFALLMVTDCYLCGFFFCRVMVKSDLAFSIYLAGGCEFFLIMKRTASSTWKNALCAFGIVCAWLPFLLVLWLMDKTEDIPDAV